MLPRNVLSSLILVSLVVCMGMGSGVGCPSTTPVPSTINIPDGYAEVSAVASSTKLFVVQAMISGQGPYNFVVDTGASVSVVSSRIASFLKPVETTTNITGIGGSISTAKFVVVDTMAIGQMEFKNFLAVVLDSAVLQSHKLDGIIGLPVFRDVTLSIHYPAKSLRARVGTLSESTCNIPITGVELTSDFTYALAFAEIQVGALKATVHIDSGSDGFLHLAGPFAGLSFVGPLTNTSASGIAGAEPSKIGTLDGDVTVGCQKYAGPQITIGGSLAILGSGGWQTSILSIDQKSKLMRLEPGGCAPNNDCTTPDPPEYRVYNLQLPFGGSAGHLEVLADGAENVGYVECDFWIAGNDCTALAVMAPITDPFPTQKAAVLSLCPRISNARDGDFGSIALPVGLLDAAPVTFSGEVYNYLVTCP